MKSFAEPAVVEATLDRIARVTPGRTAVWGRMNVHQMICHLNDSFGVAMGAVKASMATGIFQRTVMKYGGLYIPMPWPHNVQTRPEIDQLAGGSAPVEFEADRARLTANIRRFTAAQRDFTWQLHPIFAAMSEWEWMRWGYLHTDHHLRQFGS
jgi:hypothetical protein